MTVHWIDEELLKRRMAVIACRKITGAATYDVLAKNIEDVLDNFNIHEKCTEIVTDNGKNYVKAFRYAYNFSWFQFRYFFIHVQFTVIFSFAENFVHRMMRATM